MGMMVLSTKNEIDGGAYVTTGIAEKDGKVVGSYELRVPAGAVDPAVVGQEAVDDLEQALETAATRLAAHDAKSKGYS